MPGTKLVEMRWDEVSGVDHPAHMEPGWLVLKDAGAPAAQQLLAAAESVGSFAAALAAALAAVDTLSGHPEIAQQRAEEVADLLGQWQEADTDDDPGPLHLDPEALASARDLLTTLLDRGAVVKRDFTDDQRAEMAERGEAMADGSFPIANAGDLRNALRLYFRADDPAKAKRHIIARAKALGRTDLLPQSWGVTKAEPMKEAPVPDPDPKVDPTKKATETAPVVDLAKALADLPEPVRKHMEEMQAAAAAAKAAADEAVTKAAAAEVAAKVERDARLDAEYQAKARALRHLSAGIGTPGPVTKAADGTDIAPPTLAQVLRQLDEKLAPAEAAEVNRILRSADAMAARGYGEVGSTGPGQPGIGGDARDAWAAIERAATELRKADPALTREAAITKAIDVQPELARGYYDAADIPTGKGA